MRQSQPHPTEPANLGQPQPRKSYERVDLDVRDPAVQRAHYPRILRSFPPPEPSLFNAPLLVRPRLTAPPPQSLQRQSLD